MLNYYGIYPGLIGILILLIFTDFITGFIKAILQKKFCSTLCREGIIKKAATLFVIMIGVLLHVSLLQIGVPVAFKFEILQHQIDMNIPNALSMFYIFYEAASNIENFKAIGVPLPDQLKKLLKRK